MGPTSFAPVQDDVRHAVPDDFAEDVLSEMANLDEQDTNIPGTIFVSTEMGAHGPRVKWYPGRAGRALQCLVVSIEPEPRVRDDFLPAAVSRPAIPRVIEWVRLNRAELIGFWENGASWNRREVSAFLERLRPLSG